MKSSDNFDLLTQNITIDDLPHEDLKFIATFCGLDTALVLIKNASGMTFSIPKSCLKELVKNYIISHYNGTRGNIIEISYVCDVTERHIRKVVKEHLESVVKIK